jgi:hypothetical protein
MACSPASAFARSRVPAIGRRRLPEGFAPRFLAIAWPECLAVAVSAGTDVDGQRFPAGSVIVLDEYTGRHYGRADSIPQFAWRNRLPPAGYSAAPVPALADVLHVAAVDVPRETAARLATTMLARAGSVAPAVYVSERCERWWASPAVSDALALACWVARAHVAR